MRRNPGGSTVVARWVLAGGLVVGASCTAAPTPPATPSVTEAVTPTSTAADPSGPSPGPTPTSSIGSAPPVRQSPPADAPEPTTAGTILVTDAEGLVTRVDPGSGAATELEGTTVATQATASVDGTTIVHTDLAAEQPAVVAHVDGTTTSIAVPTAPYFHLVSPDGARVASLGNAPDASQVVLYLTDLSPATTVEVDRGRPYYLSWSEDGQRLAVHVDGSVVAVLEPDGARSPLAVAPGAFQAPVWTDDDRLVLVRESSGAVPVALRTQEAAGQLAIVDPADAEAATTPLAEVTGAVSFDVSGGRVAWVAGNSRRAASLGPLEVVGLDGTGHATVSAADVAMMEWSPDGTRLLFHVVDPDRGFVPHVWDGTTVTAYEPYVPTATLARQYLPFWPQYALTVTQWSSDGTAFVQVAGGDDGPGRVLVQGLDGTRRDLGEGEVAWWIP